MKLEEFQVENSGYDLTRYNEHIFEEKACQSKI